MSNTSAGSVGAMRSAGIGSSTVAIGTATAFIVIAAMLSFVADDGARAPAAWTLRGSITPEPAPPAMPAVKGRQVAHSDVG